MENTYIFSDSKMGCSRPSPAPRRRRARSPHASLPYSSSTAAKKSTNCIRVKTGEKGEINLTHQLVAFLGHLFSRCSLHPFPDVKQLVVEVLYRGLWLICVTVRCVQRTGIKDVTP